MRPTWRHYHASPGQRNKTPAKARPKTLSTTLPYRRTSPNTSAASVANTVKSRSRAKPLFYAFAISAITVAGTWWGATLKSQWQNTEIAGSGAEGAQLAEHTAESDPAAEENKRRESERRATEARERERQEQIEALLGRRARLVGVKEELERKIEVLRSRKAERERLGLREVGVEDSGENKDGK